MFPTIPCASLVLATAASLAAWHAPAVAQAVPNACALLTEAEVAQLIARGRTIYGAPDHAAIGGGSVCQYQYGQVGLWAGPDSRRKLEQFIKSWEQDKQQRYPVSGVGDSAYVFYPKPDNKYSDQGPFLVAAVGPSMITAALFAEKGHANSLMGEVCRGDQSELDEDVRKECEGVLADTGEKPESLRPAVEKLAKAVVAKVRAGRATP
jgi:hypothetical protein